ncbi:MAG: DUF1638 domain-containing protein [Clostridiales bacterium]|nr:DUF1638 domain-containing protein [Clostridiales bacterium]
MKDVSGKKILIACSMIEDEINAVFSHFDVSDTEIWWEERGHHNDPDKLREVIQTEIDRAEAGGADVIMLAYGLCGKGAVGWHTEHATLAMPRFDDCCNIMLCTGKREKRNLLEAGNMYLTKGWSKDDGALLSMLERAQERYGERRGLKVMKLMFDSYTKVTVIDTGCYELGPVKEYAEKCADLLELNDCVVPGTNHILEKLLTGNWDEDILIKRPGEAVTEEDFEFRGEKDSGSSQLWRNTL